MDQLPMCHALLLTDLFPTVLRKHGCPKEQYESRSCLEESTTKKDIWGQYIRPGLMMTLHHLLCRMTLMLERMGQICQADNVHVSRWHVHCMRKVQEFTYWTIR